MTNSKNLTISSDTAQSFLTEINRIEKALMNLKKKILLSLPAKYGSELWWEKSDKEAMEQIKAGKGIAVRSEKELKDFLGL